MQEIKSHTRSYEDRFLRTLEKLRIKYAGSVEDIVIIEKASVAMMGLMGRGALRSGICHRYNAV